MRIVLYRSEHFAGVKALWEACFPGDPLRNRAEAAIPAKLALADDLFFVAEGPAGAPSFDGRTLFETRAEREFGDRSRWQEYLKHLPQGRAAEPREIADAAVFLASDRASYISGTVLSIDGGTLHRR